MVAVVTLLALVLAAVSTDTDARALAVTIRSSSRVGHKTRPALSR
jgi:hypothetical protein